MRCLTQTVVFLVTLGPPMGIAAAPPQQAQQSSDEQASETALTQLKILRKETEDALARAQTDALLQAARGARSWPTSSQSKTLLMIPSAQASPQDLAAIAEDMSIMRRILEQKLGSASLLHEGSTAWFQRYPGFHSASAHPTASIYLDGYGAVFFVEVPFALSRPPSTEKETEPEEDPIWARVREEMYNPEAAGKSDDQSAEQFDPEQVENLKRTLVKAFIHAANIRALKPSEYITVVVAGSRSPRRGVHAQRYTLLVNGESTSTPDAQNELVHSATLVIRAKKSDIDAYFKEQLDFESFYKKAEIVTCHAHFQSLARSGTKRPL